MSLSKPISSKLTETFGAATLVAAEGSTGMVQFADFAGNQSLVPVRGDLAPTRTGGGTIHLPGGVVGWGAENLFPGSGSWGKWVVSRIGRHLASEVTDPEGHSVQGFHVTEALAQPRIYNTNAGQPGLMVFAVNVKPDVGYDLPAVVWLVHGDSPRVGFQTSDWTVATEVNATGEVIDLGNGWVRLVAYLQSRTAGGGSLKVVCNESSASHGGDGALGTGLQVGGRIASRGWVRHQIKVSESSYYESRITYDPVTGACLGLLHEGASTNLLTLHLPDATWGGQYMAYSSGGMASPSGEADAVGLIPDATLGVHTATLGYTSPGAGEGVVFSTYAKAGAHDYLRISLDSSNHIRVLFDLVNGTVVGTAGNSVASADYGIEAVGNGWFRCWVAGPSLQSSGLFVLIPESTDVMSTQFSGDGVTPSVYVWGCQAEAKWNPTSLIPTYGTTATRAADAGSGTLDTPSEITVLIDTWLEDNFPSADLEYILQVVGPTQTTGNFIRLQNTSVRISEGSTDTGVDVSWGVGAHLVIPGRNKIAVAVSAEGRLSVAVNGNEVLADLATSMPNCPVLDGFNFGDSAYLEDQKVAGLRLWERALAPEKLIALTE